jgi:hypothetical protein
MKVTQTAAGTPVVDFTSEEIKLPPRTEQDLAEGG